jgi:hypothetical protein
MKKLIMALCLSMILIGFDSTFVSANGGDSTVGTSSTTNFIEKDADIK